MNYKLFHIETTGGTIGTIRSDLVIAVTLVARPGDSASPCQLQTHIPGGVKLAFDLPAWDTGTKYYDLLVALMGDRP